jgi:hypothetical protein
MILSVLTAQGGPALAHRWHDTTGIVLLVGCFTIVWFIAWRFGRTQFANRSPDSDRDRHLNSLPSGNTDVSAVPFSAPPKASGESSPSFDVQSSMSDVQSSRTESSTPCSPLPAPRFAVFQSFSLSAFQHFSLWLVLVFSCLSVVGTELWFRLHETKHSLEHWNVALPRDAAQFRELPQSEEVKGKLQYDDATTGAWLGPSGSHWQFFYFRWNPATSLNDRVRIQLAKSHRPEICLPASGWRLQQEFDALAVDVHGTPLVFRAYEFSIHDRSAFVFFCVREDGTTAGSYGNMRESHGARWKAAMNGNRGLGQRVIEIALTGPATRAEAEQLLRSELPRLIAFH